MRPKGRSTFGIEMRSTQSNRSGATAIDLLFFILVFAIMLFAAWKTWEIIAGPSSKPVDFWTAFGPIATAAAVVVAFWIALKQQRWKETSDRQRAAVVAAGVSAKLTFCLESLDAAIARLSMHNELKALSADYVDAVVQSLDGATLTISLDELSALVPLPSNCAQDLARADALIDQVRRRFNAGVKAHAAAAKTGSPYLDPDAEKLEEWATDALNLLKGVKGVCERAVSS